MEDTITEKIVNMSQEGMTTMDIALELDIPVSAVAKEVKEVRVGEHVTIQNKEPLAFLAIEENKLLVIKHKELGMTNSELADKFGVELSAISRFLRKKTYRSWWLEYTKTDRIMPKLSFSLKNEENKLRVIQLSEEGLTNAKIASTLGASQGAVVNFLNKKTHAAWWSERSNSDNTIKSTAFCDETPTPIVTIEADKVDPSKEGLQCDLKKLIAVNMKTYNDATYSSIALELGVSVPTVSSFLNKKTYKDWWASHDKSIVDSLNKDAFDKDTKLEEYEYVEDGAQLSDGIINSAKIFAAALLLSLAAILFSLL